MANSEDESTILTRLAATLDEYLTAVPRQKLPEPPDLLAIFARLDALEKELDSSVAPELRHYMHQKSYRKAHLFLQDRDSENVNGSCRR
jgi:hypothetical protein